MGLFILVVNLSFVLDHNFLLRKTCDHKELFICDCSKPSFDVLIGDFDYSRECGDTMFIPKHIGTQNYRPPHVSYITHKMYGQQ